MEHVSDEQKPVRLLWVPADKMVWPQLRDGVTADLATFRGLIGGGYLQGIGDESWHAYIDEDGKDKGLPVNVRATRLAQALGWRGIPGDVLVGDAIFLGHHQDGREADVPMAVMSEAAGLFRWSRG